MQASSLQFPSLAGHQSPLRRSCFNTPCTPSSSSSGQLPPQAARCCARGHHHFTVKHTCCVGEAVLVCNDVAAVNLRGCVDALGARHKVGSAAAMGATVKCQEVQQLTARASSRNLLQTGSVIRSVCHAVRASCSALLWRLSAHCR
jgi:hypothetical protein